MCATIFPKRCAIQAVLIAYFALIFNFVVDAVDEIVPPPKKFNETELDKFESSKIHTYPEFIESCKLSAGYYKDPKKNPALSKTILMAGINYSYRDFYHNFQCCTDRLGIKFLPISLDKEIYDYMTKSKVMD